jgi:hypothetical protein
MPISHKETHINEYFRARTYLSFVCNFGAKKWNRKISIVKSSPDPGCVYVQLIPGLPDFSSHTVLKRGKYTKWPQSMSNCHKMYQMEVEYTNIFHSKALQKYFFLVWECTIWQPRHARNHPHHFRILHRPGRKSLTSTEPKWRTSWSSGSSTTRHEFYFKSTLRGKITKNLPKIYPCWDLFRKFFDSNYVSKLGIIFSQTAKCRSIRSHWFYPN